MRKFIPKNIFDKAVVNLKNHFVKLPYKEWLEKLKFVPSNWKEFFPKNKFIPKVMKQKSTKTPAQVLRIVITLQSGLQEFLKAEKGKRAAGFWFVKKNKWQVFHQLITVNGTVWNHLGEAETRAELLHIIQSNFSYIQNIESFKE